MMIMNMTVTDTVASDHLQATAIFAGAAVELVESQNNVKYIPSCTADPC